MVVVAQILFRPPPPPGIRHDFPLSEDMKRIETLTSFLDECVDARGVLNREGSPFFGPGLQLVNGKPTFEAPRGIYDLIIGKVNEAGQVVEEVRVSFA